jgi:predicted site-specific integrase-resolvase
MSDHYVPFSDAAREHHIPEINLYQWIENGIIKSVNITTGGILVREADFGNIPREEMPEYKKYIHLIGVQIGIGEGGRKYGIPQPTISRWVRRGLIKRLSQSGQKILIDEADLAYCSEIYKTNRGSGKWLFDPDGLPHTKK